MSRFPIPVDDLKQGVLAHFIAAICGVTAGWIGQAGYSAFHDPFRPVETFVSTLLFGFFFFGVYQVVAFVYLIPLLIIAWLPAWLLRGHVPWFWRSAWCAPLSGAAAGLLLILLAEPIHAANLTSSSGRSLVFAYRLGGLVGGFVIFSVGVFFFRKSRCA